MKREDLKAGTVYGYYEGRDDAYAYYQPFLLLSTDKYAGSFRNTEVKKTDPRDKMGTTRWGDRLVGLPAIALTEEGLKRVQSVPASVVPVPRNWPELYKRGEKYLDEDGTELGSFRLVLQSLYLHGDYAELKRAQQEANERGRKAAQEREAHEATQTAKARALETRLEALGIKSQGVFPQYSSAPYGVSLKFEDVARLLELAEEAQR